MPTLSVHILTFNSEKYIEETLQSILAQKVNFEYEIIIGDDCSKDNTLTIINSYKQNHPNVIKVYKNERQLGILKNFKTTLDNCSGDFVFDIAGDDYLHDVNALEKMVNILKKDSELGFIDCGYNIVYQETGKVSIFSNKFLMNCVPQDYKNKLLMGKVAPVGHCYKREALYKFVDFNTYSEMNISFEDYPILVNLIMNTKYERIKESLVTYRVHEKSYSHKKELKRQKKHKEEMLILFKLFSKKYNFHETLVKNYFQDHYKHLLFLSGYFEDKNLGKSTFKKINSKSLRDYIHYLASQNTFFRKLVSII